MTFEEARHLLARTGFGATPDEIRRLSGMDRKAAVNHLVSQAQAHRSAITSPPSWVHQLPPAHAHGERSQEEKKAFREARRAEGLELKQWWYRELLTTPSPLAERMTLFWHNHFTSSLHKVKWPAFLYRQNVLLRTYALGSFRDVLHGTATDAAMIRYLDTQANHKDRPNENYARELFELFTLGEGHYTEQDIKQAARAFTGWQVDPRSGTVRMHHKQHDDGAKTVFGRTGNFSGKDILELTLKRPEVAPFLVNKLWREFISDTPDAREVTTLADSFRADGYRIAPLLERLFLTGAFWALEHRGVLIKSPVELLVGTTHLIGSSQPDTIWMVHAGRRLGQDLFDPPNVKGWPGGTRWITSATLLDRWQILQRALRGHDMGGHQANQTMMQADHTHGDDWTAREDAPTIQRTLLPIEPVHLRDANDTPWQIAKSCFMDPTYQLK
ncbi:MAG: DUF1800 domain-containing protein [Nitrospiraceae bacterium]